MKNLIGIAAIIAIIAAIIWYEASIWSECLAIIWYEASIWSECLATNSWWYCFRILGH